MNVPRILSTALCLTAFAPVARAQTMQAFSPPWDDRSATITSLASWTPAPAGAKGWVTVDANGRFSSNGARLRFLGVNCVAGAAFPDKTMADAVAARLRKFGVNAVRLHHLDASWMAGEESACLVSYTANSWGGATKADPSKLRTKALDRLQYFISRLAAQGLYVDLNLLAGRQYFASDGLPAEVETMDWGDQHVLGFFDAKALALQQQFAKQLLTAPDPYSKVPLAQNPAVAFVEINNEMGFVEKWLDGGLEALPSGYQTGLRTSWNAWLKKRYASSSAVQTAWGAMNQALGPNLLKNADFANGTTGWNVEENASAVRTYAVTKDYTGGKPSLKVVVATPGTAGWAVQVNQTGLSLTKNQLYTVSFWAKASIAMPLDAALGYAGPTSYDTVQSLASVTLGTAWKRYTATFIAPVTAGGLRLNLGGFGMTKGTVWFAAATFQTGGALGTFASGVSLEKGNIPIVGRAGGSLPGQRRDWVRYLVDTEAAYWKTMRDYVKTTLGYKGLVFGTIVSTSSPNLQAALDVVDTHAYWQHPQFPGTAWDPNNWTIENVSMVNALDNTLTGLAVQRVKGKPHMVTEYQHASPNQYGAEAPLLLAAYAGLQDWDGLWFFDYGAGSADWNRGYVSDFFGQDTHPAKMANLLLAAALFRRGDVSAAKSEFSLRLRPDDEIASIAERGTAWSIVDGGTLGYPARLTLQKRFNLAVGANATGQTTLPAAPTAAKLGADTQQLTWDTSVAGKGYVTIDTPKTKAVVGFVKARAFAFGQGVVFKPGKTGNDWCTAGLTLFTGSGFLAPAGSRGVLVVTGNTANTGWKWTDATKSSLGTNWGGAPTLVEVVPLTVTLPAAASGVSVWALDAKGARKTAVAVKALTDGRCQFAAGSSGATLWYEIVVAKGAALRAPAITAAPKSAKVAKGGKVTFSVVATGTAPLSYQWYKDGKAIAGATAAKQTIATVTVASAGGYTVKVTNSVGSATSAAATLTVGP